MSKVYSEMTAEDIKLIADGLSPEWGSLGDGELIDYETGNRYHLPSEDAALLLASAHELLHELARRLNPPAPPSSTG